MPAQWFNEWEQWKMRLSDIKTIDELREFASKSVFYKVSGEYPFDVEVIRKNNNLSFRFGNGMLCWAAHDSLQPGQTAELFDNEREAEELALTSRIAYYNVELQNAKESLEELNREDKNP